MSRLEKLIEKVNETYGVEQYEPHLITVEGHGMYQVALSVANYDDPKYNQIVKVRNKIKALKSVNDRSELIRYFNSEFSLDKAMADKSGPKFMGTGEGTAWAYYEKPE